jgi:hypothetical protein
MSKTAKRNWDRRVDAVQAEITRARREERWEAAAGWEEKMTELRVERWGVEG